MDTTPKLPFNDHKHPPTRPEIDQLLGMLPSAELKHFEQRLDLVEPHINWAMHWYESEEGWGYRASYRSRVLCVLHFYKGYFSVTLSIPIAEEQEYRSLRELTPHIRQAFEHYTLSEKMKWITMHVSRKEDVNAALSIVRKKLNDLKKKVGR